jgi:AraC-like DNA-binding protein/ligand-binding sensor protein
MNGYQNSGIVIPRDLRDGAEISDSSIIRRRYLDPLLSRALEVLKAYEKATNCPISVLGPDCCTLEESKHPKAMLFCTLCKKYYRDRQKKFADQEYPCTGMHLQAVGKARRLGGSYIYTCKMGFIFWTSVIFAGRRFAGALMSSGVIAIAKDQAVDNVYRLCGGDRSREEVESYFDNIPQRTYREVKALVQMMLHCAEQLSSGGEDGGESRKRFAELEDRQTPSIRLFKDDARSRKNGEQGYPLDKERMLLASLRRGDNEAGRNILGELLKTLYAASPGNFEFFKLRAIELVVLLSRAAVGPDDRENSQILEANNRYLKKVADSQNVKELTENLHAIVDRMGGKIFSFQGVRHSSALRKAERYIWENYTRKISLQEIAEVSGLSAPYFSTIFKEEMGENLSAYLNRLRVEKASAMLMETGLSLNEIASACGFEDQSWFSKIFKGFTGLSPGKYRERGDYTTSLAGKILSQADA